MTRWPSVRHSALLAREGEQRSIVETHTTHTLQMICSGSVVASVPCWPPASETHFRHDFSCVCPRLGLRVRMTHWERRTYVPSSVMVSDHHHARVTSPHPLYHKLCKSFSVLQYKNYILSIVHSFKFPISHYFLFFIFVLFVLNVYFVFWFVYSLSCCIVLFLLNVIFCVCVLISFSVFVFSNSNVLYWYDMNIYVEI